MVHAWKACGRNPSRVRVPPPPPMRIIFLNIAYGRLGKILLDFVKTNVANTDAFCFQEAEVSVCESLRKILPNFALLQSCKTVPGIGCYAMASFFRKDLLVKKKKDILDGDTSVGAANMFSLSFGLNDLHISNIHGISQPGDKKDNPARIRQTEQIINNNSKMNGPRIIGGDFNLLPGTKSIKMFEERGYLNLIKENKIKTTRNFHAWRQAKEMVADGYRFYGEQKFADYVFVSKDVKVKNFEVPNIEISDHLPLILDFEI